MLTQFQKRYKEEFLIVQSMISQLSKALLFLSLQMVQNKHNGETFQAFFFFFLCFFNKGLVLAQENTLTKMCITHSTPKRL